ncbi:hypothetical protein DEO72_LG9g2016 [Vigna unguiculata]|uniref:Uncharacterized protein n=1 Tax=Vigna unguiculata TaxID=3917 RepID=A0A4D6N2C2_VIGUN|nr:hypothetical protein DEO72_LG9g2016 [Vigna unguiculata]
MRRLAPGGTRSSPDDLEACCAWRLACCVRRYCEAKNVSLELWLGIGAKHIAFLEL